MPAQKLPADEKKDQKLQVSVDVETFGGFVALSEALGYARAADLLRVLVNEALNQADVRIAKRQQELDEKHAAQKRAIEALGAKATEAAASRLRTANGTD